MCIMHTIDDVRTERRADKERAGSMSKTTHAHADFANRLPTPEETDSAAEALTAIETTRHEDGTLRIGEAALSGPLVDLITDFLSIVARGETVTIAPLSRRLTTQEAADMLNVSRPHLIKLLERNDIGHEKVGTHRRILLSDVLDYKARRSTGRRQALQEMQDIADELDPA